MVCAFFTARNMADAMPFLNRLQLRGEPAEDDGKIEKTVGDILHAVKTRGLDAVLEYTRKFDAPGFAKEQFCVAEADLQAAFSRIPLSDVEIMKEAIDNIRRFHEEQKNRSWFITRDDGSVLGQRYSPVERAGLYVPGGKGGTTPLISSLFMNAIPAQVAGVSELAVVSPPQADGSINDYILAAAWMLGIKEVYAVGSAWAVAGLAFGAGALRPVDVIAGPGNIFVTVAKKLLIGTVGIDMIAGPSEVLVIADAGANPAWIAADMLSQAEHDPMASAICLCQDEALCAAVLQELKVQCASLPRAEVAAHSLKEFGAVVYTPSMDVALEISNAVAPEHLELLVADPWALLPQVRHAGAVFMGYYAAEPLGDYFAGPNHVLPTMGTARFSSALGVDTFSRKTSVIFASQEFASKKADAVARLARLEGLEGHARSALFRGKC